MGKKIKSLLIISLIVLSNLTTAGVVSKIVRDTITTGLAFSPSNIILDDDRFITITEWGGLSYYHLRGPFRTPTRFVEDIDIVPTAESAVRITDTISSAMSCERYGDFNPFEHDAGVRFTEGDNLWEVFYYNGRINRETALFVARGGNIGGMGRLSIGPSFIINRTTGEIKILHEGFS